MTHNKLNNKVIVFDFDGTIADTHRYIVEITNRLADEFKFLKIEPSTIESMKNKTAKDMISILKVPIMKIPAILSRGKAEFAKEITSLKPFDGLRETLSRIKSEGVTIGILSSNSLSNIITFLENHDLKMFDFIHSTTKVWSKNTCLKKLMKSNGYTHENILYVGDETRDITAAQKLGIKIAAVTWGYNSEEILKENNPDFIIKKPEELISLITA